MTADARARGKLAERLVWTAIDLVGLVKGAQGGADAIGEFLAGLGADERDALPVVLAGMVDDSRTPDEMLSWIGWDEHGRPLDGPRSVTPRWRTSVACGTHGAFQRHLAAGEEPDPACEAAAQSVRDRGAGRKRQSRRNAAGVA